MLHLVFLSFFNIIKCFFYRVTILLPFFFFFRTPCETKVHLSFALSWESPFALLVPYLFAIKGCLVTPPSLFFLKLRKQALGVRDGDQDSGRMKEKHKDTRESHLSVHLVGPITDGLVLPRPTIPPSWETCLLLCQEGIWMIFFLGNHESPEHVEKRTACICRGKKAC